MSFCSFSIARSAAVAFALACVLCAPAVTLADSIGAIDMGSKFKLPNLNPGVRGGIPDTRDARKWPVWTGSGTPIPSGASGSRIQQAVDAASRANLSSGQEGWVIQLAPGTSNWSDDDRVDLQSNIVLRGAPGLATRINGRGKGRCGPQFAPNMLHQGIRYACGHIRTMGQFGERVKARNSQMPLGNKTWQVNNGDVGKLSISVGDWAHVINLDRGPGKCFKYELTKAAPFAQPVFSVIGKVVSVRANTPSTGTTTVELDTGTSMDWTPGVPCGTEIQRFEPIENVGIENLAIGPNLPIDHKHHKELVSFNGAVNFWITDSLIEDGDEFNIDLHYAAFGTIANNEIGRILCTDESIWDDPSVFGPGSARRAHNNCLNYAIATDFSTGDILIANNVFRNTNTEIRFFNGNYRIVYAHNYQTEFQKTDGMADGIKIHGYWNHSLLIEGNDYESNAFQSDLFWGPNGPAVLYRNRFRHDSGVNGGIYVRDIGPVGFSAQPDLIAVGNIAYAFFRNQFCNYDTDEANCYGLDQESNVQGRGGHFYAYNVARDKRKDPQGRDFIGYGFVVENVSTTVCPGGCDGPTNVEGRDEAPSSWSGVSVPGSLYASDRADWERKTGANWCAEACSFGDVHDGLGAWGDDFDETLCMIPAEIRDKGLSCTPLGGSSGGGGGSGSGDDQPTDTTPPVPPDQICTSENCS